MLYSVSAGLLGGLSRYYSDVEEPWSACARCFRTLAAAALVQFAWFLLRALNRLFTDLFSLKDYTSQ